MDNEKDVIEMLQGIGYDQIMINENVLNESINDGFKNENFRNFIIWITEEIRVLANLEERVHKSDELNEFVLELSAFLKEMICPWQSFVSGPISDRYQTRESRFTLIFYLITELMALQMYHKIKPVEEVIIKIKESPTAAAIKDITTILNMGKPPDNISTKALFDKMNSRLTEVIQKSGSHNLRIPLFAPKKKLTVEQWSVLKKHQQDLDFEYNMRRKMLLTRLDVTIQSFQWSDKLKGKKDMISATYTTKRQILDTLLTDDKATDIPALLAARDDLAIIEKTSGVNVRKNTNAKIQKHVIGQVPDRGGRAFEHAPPPPEMPSWQQNRNTGGGAGHGGSGRGDMSGGNRGGGGSHRGGGRGHSGGRGGGGGGGGGRGTGRGGSDFGQQNNRGGYQQQQGYSSQSGGYQRQFSSGSGTGYQHQQNSDGYQQYSNFSGSGYQQQSSSDGFQQQQQYSGGGGGYQQSGQTYNNRGGGSRVQGSWSQQSGNASGGFQQQQQGYQSGRGRSNYNRGGGGGLRRY